MIYLFFANGTEETEAITTFDVLKRAGADVKTVSIGDAGDATVICSHGTKVTCDISGAEVLSGTPDAVILPGGMPGTKYLLESKTVEEILQRTFSAGGLLCAICAAPSVLGKYGYLQGKNAVCFPGFESNLTGANIVDSGCVRDGRVITAKSMAYALDFGLEIAGALYGDEHKEKIRASVYGEN